MGRRSKKKRQGDVNEQQEPTKKQKKERFWIEDCRESLLKPSSVARVALEVLITQCQLYDDYRQVPQHQKPQQPLNYDKKTVGTNIITDTSGSSTKSISEDSCGHDSHATEKEEIKERNETKVFEDNNCDFSNAFVSVKRSKSAMKPIKVMGDSIVNFQPLPNGDCGDGITNPYPTTEVPDKFWSQRRRLFKLFDEGIQLDKESWYSVTPEAIANHISAHLVGNRENAIILDPFCGCGGNAIAFARMKRVKLVVCIDKDLEKLKMAASNADIYKIPKEKMVFIHGDACLVLSCYESKKLLTSKICKNEDSSDSFHIGGLELLPSTIDCIFLSPPWGGVDYAKIGRRNYTLQCIKIDGFETETKRNGEDILNEAAKALGKDGSIALFLPKNINGVALGRSVLRAGYSCPLILEKNVLNGKLKTVTAYIGLS